MKDEQILTLSEAKAHGYHLVGRDHSEQFQNLLPIIDLQETDFAEGERPYYLATIEPDYIPNISAGSIAELVAESVSSDNGNDTGDDTDDVYNIIKKLDFTATANMVNGAIGHKKYYKLTKIRLIYG